MKISEGTKKYIFLNPTGEKILFNTENCHLVNSNSWSSPGQPVIVPNKAFHYAGNIHSLFQISRGESWVQIP